MNYLRQASAEWPMRIISVSTLAMFVCLAPFNEASANSSTALRLLGKFAFSVAAGVTTELLAGEAKAMIRPDEPKPPTPRVRESGAPNEVSPSMAKGSQPRVSDQRTQASASGVPRKAETRIAEPKRGTEEPSRAPWRPEPTVPGYRFTLVWMGHDGNYRGTLIMRGVAGTFHVATPRNVIIEQDMTARAHRGDVLLVGSNPRYGGSGAPAWREYFADSFRLTQLPNGEWTIADTCDGQLCSVVYVVDANTF